MSVKTADNGSRNMFLSVVTGNSSTTQTDMRRKRQLAVSVTSFVLLLSTVTLAFLSRGGHDVEQIAHEARHPLGKLRRKLRERERVESNENHWLSFGSNSDYPFQLDANAVTFDNTYINLAAACTESIIGDDIFTHITMEYSIFSDAHSILIRRLRTRFPDAVIVLLRRPEADIAKMDQTTLMFQALLHSASEFDFSHEVSTLLQEDQRLFHYQLPEPASPTYELAGTSTIDSIVVARDLQALTDGMHVKSYALEGSWGSGDDCHLWYTTGNFDVDIVDAKPMELPVKNGEENRLHKHALEFPHGGGSFVIENRFTEPRLLSLTYLTATDLSTYPPSRIFINEEPVVELRPFHDASTSNHVVRTTIAGDLPPGNSTVRIQPLRQSEFPFRLLGASLLADDVENLALEFSLERGSLAVDSPVSSLS